MRNQQAGGARPRLATLVCSTIRSVGLNRGCHSLASNGRALGGEAAWTQGRNPKWHKSQQCVSLCSCMPQASETEASSAQTTTRHARARLAVEICCGEAPMPLIL